MSILSVCLSVILWLGGVALSIRYKLCEFRRIYLPNISDFKCSVDICGISANGTDFCCLADGCGWGVTLVAVALGIVTVTLDRCPLKGIMLGTGDGLLVHCFLSGGTGVDRASRDPCLENHSPCRDLMNWVTLALSSPTRVQWESLFRQSA